MEVKVKQGNTLLMVHLYLVASNWSLVIAKNCDLRNAIKTCVLRLQFSLSTR